MAVCMESALKLQTGNVSCSVAAAGAEKQAPQDEDG